MKQYISLQESLEEELLKSYLELKSKSFLSPEDIKEIKNLIPKMHNSGIDVGSLNIGEYKKNPKRYISKLKNPKRVTSFNKKRI